jgi:single-strand DNA-binding protein
MEPVTTMQGNLVADPTHRVTASGAIVTKFRIASSTRRQDKQTGEWVDGDPNFISVSCWRNLGMHVMTSLRKGDSVVVFGRLVYREYDDKNNVHRREHELDAIAVGPDLNRWAVDIRRPSRSQPAEAAVQTAAQAAAAGGAATTAAVGNPFGEVTGEAGEAAA